MEKSTKLRITALSSILVALIALEVYLECVIYPGMRLH